MLSKVPMFLCHQRLNALDSGAQAADGYAFQVEEAVMVSLYS